METQELIASLALTQEAAVTYTDIDQAQDMLQINWDTRAVTIPKSVTNAGVKNDHLSKKLVFSMDRYVCGVDLANHTFAIHFINVDKWDSKKKNYDDCASGVYPVTNIDLSVDGKVTCEWEITNAATQVVGVVVFALHVFTIVDSAFTYHLGTTPTLLDLLDTINATEHGKNITPDEIEVYIQKMADLSAEIDAKVAAAEAAATRAEEAAANFEVDDTLSVAGKAADAAATGAKLSQLSGEIVDNSSEIEILKNSQEIKEWIEGYRLDEANGDIYTISTDDFFVTKYIPVNGGDIIELSGYVGASGGYPIVVGYPTMLASGERTILLTGYTTATLLKNHKIVIPYENNIRYVRISMRVKDNVEISARIIKKTTEKITESNKVPVLKPFKHAENYCIGTPAELGADLDCDQIGLCSVLDIREIPCFNKNGANLYMWAAPHDGVNSFGVEENKSNAGSIYLYYADKPYGEWKLYSTTPVISRVDFQNAVSENEANSKYCDSGVNGGKVKINHISSPEVVWDENLDLTQNGVSYHGGFRIYFHASGWKRHGVNGDFVQRTFLAYSVDGKTLHSFESTDLDYPVIPDPLIKLGDRGKSSIDATCSDYLRILRHGNGWYAFYNAEPYLDGEHAESSYNVAMSYSHDGKRFMPTTDFLIHGRRDKFNKTGIPCLIERKNRLYIAYTAHDTSVSVGESFGDGIYLSEIKPDGSVTYIRELLTENETASGSEIWDSYRICAPFLLEYDDEIFLFYGGTSKANATEAYERWKNSHIGVTKLNRRFGQVWN